MADISITAANVVRVSGETDTKLAGETITAGQPLYTSSSDGKFYKADNNDTAAKAQVTHIALNGGAAGQPIVGAKPDSIVNMGATLTVGETYIVSSNVGNVAPIADISTNYVTILGVALTAANLYFKPIISGIQHA